jgi:5-formyltetrahydrofolate cyclo-ligase
LILKECTLEQILGKKLCHRSDFLESKSKIRDEIAEKRLLLSNFDIIHKSERVSENAIHLDFLRSARIVAAYLPIKNEVQTRKIIGWLWRFGKKVCVPVIKKSNMKFAELKIGSKLVKNKFGILEPVKKKFVDHKKIDAFLVPGVAFSLDGHRIGSGKGFYDRFFASSKLKGKKIGLAFNFQIVDSIESEPHDIKMDFIVAEDKIIKVG